MRMKSKQSHTIMDDTLSESIKKVLYKILEPNATPEELEAFKLFFKMLISEVTISHNMQNYVLWLVDALKHNNGNDSPLLLDYILQLAVFASSDEASLNMLRSANFFLDLMKATNDPAKKRRIMYIKLIGCLTSHQGKLDWIMNSAALTDMLILAKDEDCAIAQEGCSTIAKLLDATTSGHQHLCPNLIEVIISPLTNLATNNQEKCEGLQLDLQYVVQILEHLIDNFSTEVLDIFVKKKIANLCDNLSIKSNNGTLRMQLYRIYIMLAFYELTQIFEGISIVKQDLAEIVGMPNMMLREYKHDNYLGILDISFYAQSYYAKMKDRLPKYFYNDKIFDLKNEFLLYQCCSVATIRRKLLGIPSACGKCYGNLARMEFWSKIANQSSRESLVFLYKIEDLFFRAPPFDSEMMGLKRIVNTKRLYQQPEVRTISRVLLTVLEDILSYREKAMGMAAYSIENEQRFVAALLDVVSDFVKEFKLSWGDCLGLPDVIDLALGWLNISESTQLTVSGLKLINVAILRDMSPNIALLRDSSDSSLVKLESLLYAKCSDESWEVRSASLEILCSVTSKSSYDLVAMKNALVSENFSKMILKMAFDEDNSLVRAMTLRLIGGIVKFKETNDFSSDKFVDMVINVLKTTQNNILRKEAINVVAELFKRFSLTDPRTYKIYECILDISQPHSYEELWHSVLRFWESVINKHLSNEGIEDGKFPAAIFSKEKKKIIALTKDEIKNRLMKIFNNLSYIGCLARICQILEDENAPDAIFELACKIATDLSSILDLYGVTPNTWNNNAESEGYEGLLTLPAFMEEAPVILDELDEIIDDIISNTSLKERSNVADVNGLGTSPISNHLSPKEFLNLIPHYQSLTKKGRLLQRFKTLIKGILGPGCL